MRNYYGFEKIAVKGIALESGIEGQGLGSYLDTTITFVLIRKGP